MPNGSQSAGVPASSRTTLAGVLTGLGLLLGALVPLVDGDPETALGAEHMSMIAAAIGAMVTGFFARDNHVSSEGEKLN